MSSFLLIWMLFFKWQRKLEKIVTASELYIFLDFSVIAEADELAKDKFIKITYILVLRWWITLQCYKSYVFLMIKY